MHKMLLKTLAVAMVVQQAMAVGQFLDSNGANPVAGASCTLDTNQVLTGCTYPKDANANSQDALAVYLDLSGVNIKTISSGIFNSFTGLTTLRLDGNALTALPVNLLDQLTKLTTLRLDGNTALATLPANLLDKLTALTTLNLGGNTALTTIPSGYFNQLTALTTLRLDGNSNSAFTTLPANLLDRLTALTTLNLGGNTALTAIPSGYFNQLTKLTTLKLDGNIGLTVLPANLLDPLNKLTTLSLGGITQLKSLPLNFLSPSSVALPVLTSITFTGNTKMDAKCTVSTPFTTVASVPGVCFSQNVGSFLDSTGAVLSGTTAGSACAVDGAGQLTCSLGSVTATTVFGLDLSSGSNGINSATLLVSIAPKAFDSFTSLKFIKLDSNKQLAGFPDNLLDKLTALTDITLSGNTALPFLPLLFFQSNTAGAYVKMDGNTAMNSACRDSFGKPTSPTVGTAAAKLYKDIPLVCYGKAVGNFLDASATAAVVGTPACVVDGNGLLTCSTAAPSTAVGLDLVVGSGVPAALPATITSIAPLTFDSFTALKYINLGGHTNLRSLPNNLLDKLVALTDVTISGNTALVAVPLNFFTFSGSVVASVILAGNSKMDTSCSASFGKPANPTAGTAATKKITEIPLVCSGRLVGTFLDATGTALTGATPQSACLVDGNGLLTCFPLPAGITAEKIIGLDLSAATGFGVTGAPLPTLLKSIAPKSFDAFTALQVLKLDGHTKFDTLPMGLLDLNVALTSVTFLGDTALKQLPFAFFSANTNLKFVNTMGTGFTDNTCKDSFGSLAAKAVTAIPSTCFAAIPSTPSSDSPAACGPGCVAGAVIGSIVGVALIGVLVWYFAFRSPASKVVSGKGPAAPPATV